MSSVLGRLSAPLSAGGGVLGVLFLRGPQSFPRACTFVVGDFTPHTTSQPAASVGLFSGDGKRGLGRAGPGERRVGAQWSSPLFPGRAGEAEGCPWWAAHPRSQSGGRRSTRPLERVGWGRACKMGVLSPLTDRGIPQLHSPSGCPSVLVLVSPPLPDTAPPRGAGRG